MSDCLEKCYIGHSMAGICKQTPCKLGNKNKKKKSKYETIWIV